MANEANKILDAYLKRLQQNAAVRKSLAICILLILSGIAGFFIFEILPRQYALNITGGNILSNRHYLAKVMQEEIAHSGVALEVKPTSGSQEALEMVSQGKLDFAFIQGGLDLPYPNIVHVATVAPELLHFLVRSDIKDIADLRGKRINLGTRQGGTRIIAKQVLEFSGLQEGMDYVESNLNNEDLLSLHTDRLPDAIVMASFAPADMADYLVKERNYHLIEIPFPSSLALRLGWVADSKILAYMYSVEPPVPNRDIKTVGVNLHLVANKNVDARAVFKLLESLYSPDLEVRLKIKIDEKNILASASYPLAEGTKLYLNRNNPFFSNETLDKIKALFGLILSVGSTLLVIVKWFKGEPIEPAAPPTDDKIFMSYLEQVVGIEREFNLCMHQGAINTDIREKLLQQLSSIKALAISRLSNANLNNPQLPQNLLLVINDTRSRLEHV